jgi:hypothetical protein
VYPDRITQIRRERRLMTEFHEEYWPIIQRLVVHGGWISGVQVDRLHEEIAALKAENAVLRAAVAKR